MASPTRPNSPPRPDAATPAQGWQTVHLASRGRLELRGNQPSTTPAALVAPALGMRDVEPGGRATSVGRLAMRERPQGPAVTDVDVLEQALEAHARRRATASSPTKEPASGPTGGRPIPVAATGVAPATYEVVLRLAERFGTPTPQQVFSAGREMLPARGLAAPNRQALRAQVITRAAVYFRAFARPGWTLCERPPSPYLDVTYDVVWARDGRRELDQLVLRHLGPRGRADLRTKTEQRLRDAKDPGDGGLDAIRVVLLLHPDLSFEVRS